MQGNVSPFELAWAACSCFAPQKRARHSSRWALSSDGRRRASADDGRVSLQRRLARWRISRFIMLPDYLSVCLSLWRPWFSMSLRRLDSADQWQSYQSGPVPGTLGPLLRGFRLALSGQAGLALGLDIGLKHRIRAFNRRTQSQSRHITRRRYNLQAHVHVPCTAAHTKAGALGGDGWMWVGGVWLL